MKQTMHLCEREWQVVENKHTTTLTHYCRTKRFKVRVNIVRETNDRHITAVIAIVIPQAYTTKNKFRAVLWDGYYNGDIWRDRCEIKQPDEDRVIDKFITKTLKAFDLLSGE